MTAPIRFLTIHCAATPAGRAVSAARLNEIAMQRFGQRSYHWLVLLDGTAVRNLEDHELGAHVGRRNTGNVGICYVGGMDRAMKRPEDTRTPGQRATLRRLVAEYRARYPGIIVRGHRDWPGVAKACPSFDVATEL